ncbi:hypothetical protein JMA_29800 [Jeotgalibacillus malaysiensis]|uniref:Uncharacterized protein n=1 Tax=Jeotgalibacillus malaysiensis TaxID=1508404 RepID=A0A0B5AUA2_9BACL|nr:hypothetical protein [Jeotgalibacillus malaysiensis]AJD92297.1 hypothetical protein JMA_29800 [Jeotgalibacillus malaysiensis]
MAMEQLSSNHLSSILKEAHKKGEKEELTAEQMVQWLASKISTVNDK